MKSSNQINVPQARDAMDKFKMQAASDLDVPVTYWMLMEIQKIFDLTDGFQNPETFKYRINTYG